MRDNSTKKMPTWLALLIVAIVFAVTLWGRIDLERKGVIGKDPLVIDNFEECVRAGNPVLESYPERCITRDGQSFTNTKQILIIEDE
ncbi:hypothetical protein KC842_02575 [Candidatus Nomurabacteria bacterium]|nr:hypothetical protein [Candidatus Nomurabacteria bacterium]USN94795.1 MAG: hypothetical protein H6791_03505 [Candidatus Nomurabacteria bacterium]